MFRLVAQRLGTSVQNTFRSNIQRHTVGLTSVRACHGGALSEADYDDEAAKFFERTDIDGWDVRRVLTNMQGEDLIPEPKIIIAALHAIRRLNDYALAVRYLEALQDKCGSRVGDIWPYVMQEIQPTLTELGISSPKEMGYDKPELACPATYEMHE